MKRFLLVPLLMLTTSCSMIMPSAQSQPDKGGAPQTRSTKLSDVRRSIVNLTNNYRTSKGKPELIFSPELSEMARQHSAKMASGSVRFGHGGFKCRAKAARTYLDVNKVAENVAMNYGSKNPATTAMNGWKKSPGHNKNMLGDFTLIGVGVARNSQGQVYATQLFAK